MASQFDNVHAAEYANAFAEFIDDTVIRRIGGRKDRTEKVAAVVEIDSGAAGVVAARGGLLDNDAGEYFEQGALLEVAAGQEVSVNDAWVVDDRVWQTLGSVTQGDAGSKTVVIARRIGRRGREPRVTSGRR